MKITQKDNVLEMKFDSNTQLFKALSSNEIVPDLGIMFKDNPEFFNVCKEKIFEFVYKDKNTVQLSTTEEGLELIVHFPENSFFGNSKYLASLRLPISSDMSDIKSLLKKKKINFKFIDIKEVHQHTKQDMMIGNVVVASPNPVDYGDYVVVGIELI